MRILITQRGSQFLKEIIETVGTSHSQNRKKGRMKCNSKKRRLTIPHINRYQANNSIDLLYETNSHLKTITPFIKTSQSTQTNETNAQKIKTVKLTMSKITFPKPFIGKYEAEEKNDKTIISHVNNFLPSLTTSNETKLFPFNEIIPPKKITRIKKDFLNETRSKEKMSRIDETCFRSIYLDQTPLEKLNEMMKYPKINSKKENLIKYLSESDKLNPVSLKTIVESDSNQISRVNKMCQILFHQEDQQRLVKEIIQTKLKEKKATDKIEFQNGIDIMKQELNDINAFFNKYSKRVHNRERYREIYNDMVVNHWKKYDTNRLLKGRTKNRMQDNSAEGLSNMTKSNNDILFNEEI